MGNNISPESQRIEYKSSWQEEYFEWVSGYANANGGTLYIGVNDDGYVVGVKDTRYLLDTLPNQINAFLGITVVIDHGVAEVGKNLKYDNPPKSISEKPINLYVNGILTEKALIEIDAAPDEVHDVSTDVQVLYEAAPGFVKQLRKSSSYRENIKEKLSTWKKENPVYGGTDGLREYIWIEVDPLPFGVSYHGKFFKKSGGNYQTFGENGIVALCIGKVRISLG